MLAATFSFNIEKLVWVIAATICLTGSLGTVALRNTVHNALSLVATLFGVAIMFVLQQAYFLAAIQVIVYAGAIVILFLFVIMLLGIDSRDDLYPDHRPWYLPLAAVVAVSVGLMVIAAALVGVTQVTGARSQLASLKPDDDIARLGEVLFTNHVYAFEITAVLLTIAVVGAVVLVRKAGPAIDLDEFPLPEPEPEPEPEPDYDDEVDEFGDEPTVEVDDDVEAEVDAPTVEAEEVTPR